jgi:hypothetical protein
MSVRAYDSSWDSGGVKAFDKKYEEWRKRDWMKWLGDHLVFPFEAKRMEDEDDAYFTDIARHEPFRLGHTMEVLGLSPEDDLYGIIAKVREENEIGTVPLCDLEVRPKHDKNFWPVREYAVWFANR